MYHIESDGTVVDKRGRLIFLPIGRFRDLMASRYHCFICAAAKDAKPFNDEHVMPNWILRSLELHDKSITLSNRTQFGYSQYVVPCCQDCNSQMGRTIEKRVQRLFEKGQQSLTDYLKSEGPLLLIAWLALIFIKAYHKDIFLRLNRDRRQSSHTIADLYEWENLHHIYCIARTFYSGASFDYSKAMSSLVILPAKVGPDIEQFDYCDLYDTQSVLMRYKEIAVLAVFNDGCASQSIIRDMIRKVRGPLAPIQLRELLARLAYANHIVKTRPRFGSQIDIINETYVISAERTGKFTAGGAKDSEFGSLMYYLCKDALNHYPSELKQPTIDKVLSGKWTFITDSKGRFISIE